MALLDELKADQLAARKSNDRLKADLLKSRRSQGIGGHKATASAAKPIQGFENVVCQITGVRSVPADEVLNHAKASQ